MVETIRRDLLAETRHGHWDRADGPAGDQATAGQEIKYLQQPAAQLRVAQPDHGWRPRADRALRQDVAAVP